MINSNIDLGQIIIACLITIVGFFVKRELNHFTKKLETHDTMLNDLLREVNQLIGYVGMRKSDRDKL